MDVLVTETNRTEHGVYFSGTCGKVSAYVSFYDGLGVRVCCRNSSHRVWKGSGRGFNSVAEALEAYKSPEMKAIIRAADVFNVEAPAPAIAA